MEEFPTLSASTMTRATAHLTLNARPTTVITSLTAARVPAPSISTQETTIMAALVHKEESAPPTSATTIPQLRPDSVLPTVQVWASIRWTVTVRPTLSVSQTSVTTICASLPAASLMLLATSLLVATAKRTLIVLPITAMRINALTRLRAVTITTSVHQILA